MKVFSHYVLITLVNENRSQILRIPKGTSRMTEMTEAIKADGLASTTLRHPFIKVSWLPAAVH